MAQQVEHVLGKDEVTGSNPVISSIKTPKIGVFSYFFSIFLGFCNHKILWSSNYCRWSSKKSMSILCICVKKCYPFLLLKNGQKRPKFASVVVSGRQIILCAIDTINILFHQEPLSSCVIA